MVNALGTPDFGELLPPFNPLIYPRRILIQVFESLFSQQSIYGFDTDGAPSPNPFRLVKKSNGEIDEKQTRIVISDIYTEDDVIKDARPHVIVERGPLEIKSLSLGSRFGGAPTSANNPNKTFTEFADFTEVPISIHVYSRSMLECEQIAWIIAFFLRVFRSNIRAGAKFNKIGSPIISAVTPVQVSSEIKLYACTITLLIYQTLSWTTKYAVTYDEIVAGIENLSNSPWPTTGSDLNVTLNAEE